MSDQSQENLFQPISESKQINKAFDQASKKKVIFTLWLKNQKVKFETTISEYVAVWKKLSFQFPVTMHEQKFREAVQSQHSNEIFGSAIIDQQPVFFQTFINGQIHDRTLDVDIPTKLFKLQRRNTLRVPVRKGIKISVNLTVKGKPNSDYTVVDVSVGGIGIEIAEEAIELFPTGTKVSSIEFKIKDSVINTSGEVRHVKTEASATKGKKRTRAGISFTKLSEAQEKILVQHVLDESRRVFTSRF